MKVALPKDLAQEVALSKRRQAELCRQKRIFNARNRIIGGDPEAWDVQVHDQKIKEATEKARDETFAAEMRQNDKIMCILENRERRDKKNLCRAINNFQQNFQMPETRREFDLSDPLALRKDLPARQSDNDVRNTISGMQKFMGEDLNFHERKKFQEEQNREWSLQQQREWKNAQADHKFADIHLVPPKLLWMTSCRPGQAVSLHLDPSAAEDLYTKTRLQFDETARHLQDLESATRTAVCASVKEFNKNQALESAEKKKREKNQEQEDNLAEISNLLRGDLLSENPQQAASSFGPHRVVPDRWKGMNQEQLEQIRIIQKQQIQEKLKLPSRNLCSGQGRWQGPNNHITGDAAAGLGK
ncbi:RIB43A-like with coiled-coils protein 2 isoform X3 [Choloepus didactylus]|uniref:RIB43A-like with coiled-coils protein 2 isoform X3 n=1 Tax=Choloepus didactylus TaxID=27675 RepID=UPI00189DA4B2|nr:RIB43A-like with coiled-coils protein 2 isoform X3 [Choloepus didactylus]XP_037702476.1 RIB43A-like with coiled-coils protein 2 isoform X3 [Choloepus didactylus]